MVNEPFAATFPTLAEITAEPLLITVKMAESFTAATDGFDEVNLKYDLDKPTF